MNIHSSVARKFADKSSQHDCLGRRLSGFSGGSDGSDDGIAPRRLVLPPEQLQRSPHFFFFKGSYDSGHHRKSHNLGRAICSIGIFWTNKANRRDTINGGLERFRPNVNKRPRGHQFANQLGWGPRMKLTLCVPPSLMCDLGAQVGQLAHFKKSKKMNSL